MSDVKRSELCVDCCLYIEKDIVGCALTEADDASPLLSVTIPVIHAGEQSAASWK